MGAGADVCILFDTFDDQKLTNCRLNGFELVKGLRDYVK